MQVIDAETYYPSAFVNILHRCLSFNPTDRPSMREVVQQLMEVCLLLLDINDVYSMPPTLCSESRRAHMEGPFLSTAPKSACTQLDDHQHYTLSLHLLAWYSALAYVHDHSVLLGSIMACAAGA